MAAKTAARLARSHGNAPRLCAPTVRLVLSAVFGVLGGVVLMMSWWRFGSVMACVVVVGLMLGFLVASVVLFTPLGRELLKVKAISASPTMASSPAVAPQAIWTCSGAPTWSSG